jgi:uncharacterized protein (DUF111 family)
MLSIMPELLNFPYLKPLAKQKSAAEQATERFSQFSSLQIRILNVQPHVPEDMLELVTRVIESTEARLPALEQSIQEIRTEWELL